MAKKKTNVLAIILGSILLIYTVLLIAVLTYDVLNSLKTRYHFANDPIGLPGSYVDKNGKERGGIMFSNYADAFRLVKMNQTIDGVRRKVGFITMFWYSILYSVGCSFTATLVPCLVAYVTAKYKFRFNKVIYYIVIFAMVTPIVGSAPSQIYVMDEIFGMYDTIPGMWFMSANFLGTYYLVFYSIFKGLSWEYAEAAFIDGASHLNVMVRVMFPLVRTTFGVIMLLNFIGFWNNYQTPLMFMPDYPTAAVAIQYLVAGGDNAMKSQIPVILASSVLLMAPALILFILFRNKLAGNLTVGGIKG